MLLYPSMVLLLPHHQVLCYCSLAKPDPHTKCKSLVSQDCSYWVVFVDKNVMAEIVLNLSLFTLLFMCASQSSVTTLVASSLTVVTVPPHAW